MLTAGNEHSKKLTDKNVADSEKESKKRKERNVTFTGNTTAETIFNYDSLGRKEGRKEGRKCFI